MADEKPSKSTVNASRGRTEVFLTCVALFCALAACAEPEEVWPTRAELMVAVEQGITAENPVVRAETMRILGRSGLPELEEYLRRGAADSSELVRASAVYLQLALRQNGAERALLERIASGTRETRREALLLALRFGRPGFAQRVVEQTRREATSDLRQAAFEYALFSGRTQSLLNDEFLLSYLEDQPDVEPEILRLLIERRHAETENQVQEALLSDDEDDRQWALKAMAFAPIPSAWSYLRWLRDNGTETEHDLAVLALVRIGDRSGVRDAVSFLREGSTNRKLQVLRALAGVAEPELHDAFSSYLDNQRADIRRAALDGLMTIGITQAELFEVLDDTNPDLAFFATQELQTLEPQALVNRVCPRLRMGADAFTPLRLLWFLRDAGVVGDELTDCRSDFEALMLSDNENVAGLAANLFFAVSDMSDPNIRPDSFAPLHVLYAYLNESLDHDPTEFRHVYRELLDHELLTIRLLASVGLLKSTQ